MDRSLAIAVLRSRESAEPFTLADGSTLAFVRGEYGGPPVRASANKESRYLTWTHGEETQQVCKLKGRRVVANLFLCADGLHFAVYTVTDDYDSLGVEGKVTTWVYDPDTRNFSRKFAVKTQALKNACFSADGKRLAVAHGLANASIRFYDTEAQTLLHEWSCNDGNESDMDESNIFESIALGRHMGQGYILAHLCNTITPQKLAFEGSAMQYYDIVRYTGVCIRRLDGSVLGEIIHPNIVHGVGFEGDNIVFEDVNEVLFKTRFLRPISEVIHANSGAGKLSEVLHRPISDDDEESLHDSASEEEEVDAEEQVRRMNQHLLSLFLNNGHEDEQGKQEPCTVS